LFGALLTEELEVFVVEVVEELEPLEEPPPLPPPEEPPLFELEPLEELELGLCELNQPPLEREAFVFPPLPPFELLAISLYISNTK
jgi:hypothetical protein